MSKDRAGSAVTRNVLLVTLGLAVVAMGWNLVEAAETPKAEVLRVAGIGLLFAWLVRRPRGLGVPLDWAVAGWLAVEAITTLTSRAPWLSVFGEQEQHEGLLTSLALAGVYVGARFQASDAKSVRRVLDAWLVAAAVAAVVALLQAARIIDVVGAQARLGAVVRPFGTLGHPNLLGVVTASAAAIALARARTESSHRAWYASGILLFAVATAITFSRGAWLALAAGATVVMAGSRGRRFEWSRRTRLVLAAVGAVAIVVLVVRFGGLFASRLGEMFTAAGSGGTRLEIWRVALAAWRARPLVGHGPDTLALVSTQFETIAHWRDEWGGVIGHAHSIYLHTLATRGVLGLLAGLGLAFGVVQALRRARARGDEAADAAIAHAGAYAALAVAGGFGAWGMCGATFAAILAGQTAGLAAGSGAGVDGGPVEPAPHAAKAAKRPSSGRAAGSPERSKSTRPRRRWAVQPAGVVGVAAAVATAAFAVNELVASHAIAVSQTGLALAALEPAERATPMLLGVYDLAAPAATRLPWDDHAPRLKATALVEMSEKGGNAGWLLGRAEQSAREAVQRVPLRAMNQESLAEVQVRLAHEGRAEGAANYDSTYALASRLWPASAVILADWSRARILAGHPHPLEPVSRAALLYPRSGLAQLVVAEASLAVRDTTAARAALERARTGEWYGDVYAGVRAENLRKALGADR